MNSYLVDIIATFGLFAGMTLLLVAYWKIFDPIDRKINLWFIIISFIVTEFILFTIYLGRV